LLDWISKPFDEKELYRAFDAVRQRVGPARVLLIEDDPSAREVLRQQLDWLGVSCIEAKDGAEGESISRQQS
jgi:DNA-binding response OmpR family regulator